MEEHSTKPGKQTGKKIPATVGKAPGGAGIKPYVKGDKPGSTFTFQGDSKRKKK